METSVKKPKVSKKLPPSILGDQLRWWPKSFVLQRPNQSKVFRLLEKRKNLILQAPTGFGKSVIVLAGIWYRHIWGERQLYLFAKTKAQLQSVFLHNLKKHFSRPPADQLTIVPLIARKDLCCQPLRDSCWHCPDKRKARYLSASDVTELMQQFILGNCPDNFVGFRKHLMKRGCPYSIILRMIPQANIVLLTQGYLESIFLRDILDNFLLKAERYNFHSWQREVIIDEAHNFGSTVEAVLTREQLERAQEIGFFPVVKALIQLLEKPLGRVERPREAQLPDVVQIDQFLRQKRNRKFLPSEDYDTLQAVRSFVERGADYWVLNEQGLVQLNPWPSTIFKFLRPRFDRIVLLSGTFHKLPLYTRYYGLNNEASPFTLCRIAISRERRHQLMFGAMYHPAISSKLQHRTPEFYTWSADLVHEMALLAGDHTLVFVPSYETLESLYPLVHERLNGQLSVYREPTKSRIPYLKALVQGPPSVVVAVFRGKFSEGVEIIHPTSGRSRIRLIVLVGLPFPPPTPEHQLLERLYRARWGQYIAQWALIERLLYTQVQQCLGRGIRSDQDRAAAIILDYRVITRMYLPGIRIFRTRAQLTNTLVKTFFQMKQSD